MNGKVPNNSTKLIRGGTACSPSLFELKLQLHGQVSNPYSFSIKQNYKSSATTKASIPPYTEKSWTTPGTYTWTVPAGVTRIRVAVCGGGGSGAGTSVSVGHGFAGGTSSFGNLLSATGGGGAAGTSGGGGSPGTAGIPNGYAGEWSKGGYTKGFALSFEKTDGEYGRGSGFNIGNGPMQGGSGRYDSQYVDVIPNAIYEIKVGEGGAKPTNFASFYDEGISGFVLIAYGEGIE